MFSAPAPVNSKLDSLTKQLATLNSQPETFQRDTALVNTLTQLCWDYRTIGELDKAKNCGTQGVVLAEKLRYAIGLAHCCNNLGSVYLYANDHDSAMVYYDKALAQLQILALSTDTVLSKRAKQYIANILGNIGLIYQDLSDYPKALDYQMKSLEIKEKMGNKQGISNALGNIGNIYCYLSDYPKALDYYLKSLKIDEEMGNKQGISTSLGSIGNIYNILSDYPKALVFYLKSLKISKEINDIQGIADVLGNIGLIYYKQGNLSRQRGDTADEGMNYSNALDCYLKSLKINEKTDNKQGIAITLVNIGDLYVEQGSLSLALEYKFKSLKIGEEIGYKYSIALALGSIGTIYTKQKKYSLALEYAAKAGKLANEIGDLNTEKECENALYEAFKATGNNAKALNHYERYIILKDSIFKLDNQKEILRKQMKFDYEKKATADSVINAEAQKVKEAQIQAQHAQIKQEQIQRYALYGGLALVVLFAGFIYNRFRVTQKQKKIIEEQKKLVDIKNEEILDSIHYAKRIQQALLPTDYVLKKHLPEHFIFYKPKNIVSGDFYWTAPLPPEGGFNILPLGKPVEFSHMTGIQNPPSGGRGAVFAVADCTGHGVPGAFMSLLNISFLNEIITEKKITRPDEILNRVREEVVKALNPEGGVEKGMDGMDCSLISFGLRDTGYGLNAKLRIACANNPIWIVRGFQSVEKSNSQLVSRNPELFEIKPDRQPVGFSYNPKPFTLQETELQAGDTIYMITDGFGDQFGGPKGKRFKREKLKELLLSISDKPMEEQKNMLEKTFNDWKGNSEQTDDVTVIGIKV